MNFQPLGDQLLVKPEPYAAEHHGLVIPECARRGGALGGDKFLRFGHVIAAGPGDSLPIHPGEDRRRGPMNVQVGDRILYDHPSDRQYRIGMEDYVILHEEQHVLAVIEDCGI